MDIELHFLLLFFIIPPLFLNSMIWGLYRWVIFKKAGLRYPKERWNILSKSFYDFSHKRLNLYYGFENKNDGFDHIRHKARIILTIEYAIANISTIIYFFVDTIIFKNIAIAIKKHL